MNTMFAIRTDRQREISVNSTIKSDLASTVRGLRELTHNLVEIVNGGGVKPIEVLFNYYAGEKAKLDAALAIARAVTFGVAIKMDDGTGRYVVNVKKEAGLNRHYATLERHVAAQSGLMNNTLHDELKSQRPVKAKGFDVGKRADALVKAALDANVSIDALRKAVDKAILAHFADAKPAKPIMDAKPSHPQTGRSVVRLFNRETGTFEEAEPMRKTG